MAESENSGESDNSSDSNASFHSGVNRVQGQTSRRPCLEGRCLIFGEIAQKKTRQFREIQKNSNGQRRRMTSQDVAPTPKLPQSSIRQVLVTCAVTEFGLYRFVPGFFLTCRPHCYRVAVYLVLLGFSSCRFVVFSLDFDHEVFDRPIRRRAKKTVAGGGAGGPQGGARGSRGETLIANYTAPASCRPTISESYRRAQHSKAPRLRPADNYRYTLRHRDN